MLSNNEKSQVREGFELYEHDWTFAASYLGEPFITNNCLVYFDGTSINLAAFSLGDARRIVSTSEISSGLRRIASGQRISLIHIWGRFEVAEEYDIHGERLRLLGTPDTTNGFDGEYSVDIPRHNLVELPEARKAIRAASNKGLAARVVHRDYFRADHFRLVEEWVNSRPIGLPSISAMTSLPAYIRHRHVELVEVSQGQRCCGFGVMSFPNPSNALLVATFSEQRPGARIEDRILGEVLEVCKQRGIDRLHLGYAGKESLARFKRKWGASQTGPDYWQAVYCSDGGPERLVNSLAFFWASRLHDVGLRR